jgi:hypothetical protein
VDLGSWIREQTECQDPNDGTGDYVNNMVLICKHGGNGDNEKPRLQRRPQPSVGTLAVDCPDDGKQADVK